jgi:hypothetical protein
VFGRWRWRRKECWLIVGFGWKWCWVCGRYRVQAAARGSDSGFGKLVGDGEEGGTTEREEERLGAERRRRGRKVAAVLAFGGGK